MFKLDSAGAALGWKISISKVSEGFYHCILYNLLHKDITANQPLSFLYFYSYLTIDTASAILLKSGNAFFDPLKNSGCIVFSIPQNNNVNDSVIIKAADMCGDPILRHFLATGFLDIRMSSIHPNPASNEIAIETESSSPQEVDVIIYNDLGRECWADKYFLKGKVKLNIPIRSLATGTYHVVLKSSSGSVSSEFIKIH